MTMEKINCWAFYYNPMIHESASYIVSYHKTKSGAEKAMDNHKQEEYKEWEESNEWHKQWCKEKGHEYREISKFGAHQHWSVDEFELIIQD